MPIRFARCNFLLLSACLVSAAVLPDSVPAVDSSDNFIPSPEFTLTGGDGNDLLQGSDSADTIFGGLGADRIFGGDEDDLLWGGGGNDTILGGDGNDMIYGGDGIDRIYGGDGADRFVFDIDTTETDEILDFDPAEGDEIWIRIGKGRGAGGSTEVDLGLKKIDINLKGAAADRVRVNRYGDVEVRFKDREWTRLVRTGRSKLDVKINRAGDHLRLRFSQKF